MLIPHFINQPTVNEDGIFNKVHRGESHFIESYLNLDWTEAD